MLFVKYVVVFCACILCFGGTATLMLAVVTFAIDEIKNIKDSLSNKQDEDD